MIDFLTVIPIWLTYFVYPDEISINEITSFSDFLNYTLYGAHTLRILRVLRLRRKFLHIDDEVQRSSLNMMLSITTMILFG
jgi:hypothetical protein